MDFNGGGVGRGRRPRGVLAAALNMCSSQSLSFTRRFHKYGYTQVITRNKVRQKGMMMMMMMFIRHPGILPTVLFSMRVMFYSSN